MAKKQKEMTEYVKPDGENDYKESDGDNESDGENTTEDIEGAAENAKEEAQNLYDTIMEEDPEDCKELYNLLKDKYEGEEKTTKKEVAKESETGEANKTFNADDLPE